MAEIDGRIAGACSSLIVDLGPNPLRPHTWAGITDSGYFTNHNPDADTLYGADVYVHPDFWGMGWARRCTMPVKALPASEPAPDPGGRPVVELREIMLAT